MTAQSISAIQYFLWVIGPALQLVIVMVMYYKRLYRDLPLFFSYTVFHVVQFVVALIALRMSYATYFYIYWGTELIDAFFGLLVIQEIYSRIFRDLHGFQAFGLVLFRWIAIILTTAAVVSALAATGTGDQQLIAGLMVLERSVQLLQGGLVIFLFLLCRTFALAWESHTFGIALGLGVVAVVSLAAATMRARFGDSANQAVTYLLPIGANISIVIWAWFLSRKVPMEMPSLQAMHFSEDLRTWNQLLEESRRP